MDAPLGTLRRATARCLIVALAPLTFDACVSTEVVRVTTTTTETAILEAKVFESVSDSTKDVLSPADAGVEALRRPAIRDRPGPRRDGQRLVGRRTRARPLPAERRMGPEAGRRVGKLRGLGQGHAQARPGREGPGPDRPQQVPDGGGRRGRPRHRRHRHRHHRGRQQLQTHVRQLPGDALRLVDHGRSRA